MLALPPFQPSDLPAGDLLSPGLMLIATIETLKADYLGFSE
jgi:hypothetical protein